MIKGDVLKTGDCVFKAYIDIQKYYVCDIQEDLVIVKKIDDISMLAVPLFELKTDIWHLTQEGATQQLPIINKRENVSIYNRIYDRDFRLNTKDIDEGTVFYEAFLGKSSFIQSHDTFGIIELTVNKLFKSTNPKYSGKYIVELYGIQLNINNAIPETFSVLLDSILITKNLFKNQAEIISDMLRTGKAILYDIKVMYDPTRSLYNSLAENEKAQVEKYINHYKMNADTLEEMYNNYTERNKKTVTATNAERDTLNILKTIDE